MRSFLSTRYLLDSVLDSGDTRIADFFLSIFRDRDFNTPLKERLLTVLFTITTIRKRPTVEGELPPSKQGHDFAYDHMMESALYVHPGENDLLEIYLVLPLAILDSLP
nr:hypothetical protein Clen_130 [Cedratvirus lena]